MTSKQNEGARNTTKLRTSGIDFVDKEQGRGQKIQIFCCRHIKRNPSMTSVTEPYQEVKDAEAKKLEG